MGFFSGTAPSVQKVSTQNMGQKQLLQALLSQASEQLQNFKPYLGATKRMAPTGREKEIFQQGKEITGRQAQRPSLPGAQQQFSGARSILQQDGEKKTEDSAASIVQKGNSQMIAKLLEQFGG